MVLTTLLPLASGHGRILLVTFPALAVATALVLYLRAPAGYVAFTWWIWLLTPAVRRLVDYEIGWTPVSTVMLTPYLVTVLAALTLLRRIGNLSFLDLAALGFTVAGIAYAYVIGVWSVGAVPATFGLLTWLVPVIFGFHLAATWRRYEFWREATQTAFGYGMIVLAAYGVLQFAFVPGWDGFWMDHAGMSSIGRPVPFQVRVFSTLNAPGVFAIFLMAGLLIGFSRRSTIRGSVAQPLVWLGFLLSQVRSAWLGYGVGLALLLLRTPLSRSLKLLAAGVLLLLAILPLVQIDAVERVALPRIMSLGQLGSDHSLRERMQLYGEFFDVAAGNIPGGGIGSTNLATKLSNNGQLTRLGVIDSGLLEIMFVFGWPGSLLYALGVGLAMLSALWGWNRGTDPFTQAARAVVVAIFVQIVFFNPLGGAVGMIFWSFLGLILAGQSFHDAARKVAR